MTAPENIRIVNEAGEVLYEGPRHGCRQHYPTDPPHPECIDCMYRCIRCDKLQRSVRRWIDDDDAVVVCTCDDGVPQALRRAVSARSFTAMNFWNRSSTMTKR
jgi:hypothetical protein